MNGTNKNKEESLWQQMLESLLTTKTEKVGNLLWCGSPKAGKKKLISSVQTLAKHKKPDTLDDKFKSLEKVYIMDFKYLKIVNKKDDFTEEQSKMNFYIMNKQYEYMKEFLTNEILTNLLVVIVVDLENPKKLRENVEEWISFLKGSIDDYISGLSDEKKKMIKKGFKEIRLRMKAMTSLVALQELKESGVTEGNENPLDLQQSLALSQEDEEDEDIEIPLLLVGNKTDCLDSLSDETLRDHIQYVLRELAVKHNALVLTTSSHKNRNLNLLYKLLGGILVDLKESDTSIYEPNYNIANMFIPLGADDQNQLETQLGKFMNYKFKEDVTKDNKKDEEDKGNIKQINDFLSEVSKGVFNYENEQPATRRNNDYSNLRTSNNSSRLLGNSSRLLGDSSRYLGNRRNEKKDKAETLSRIRSILEKK